MVVVVLLDKLLAAETQGKRRTHREIWGLLDLVMQLQAKSSMSRHREPGDGQNIMFVPSENHDSSWQILDYEGEGTTQVSSCRCPWTGKNAWSVPDLGPWEKEREELGISHRYNQRCVGRVNPNEDRSLSPLRRGLRPSTATSSGHQCLGGTGHPPTSQSIRESKALAYGWETTDWSVRQEGRGMMIS